MENYTTKLRATIFCGLACIVLVAPKNIQAGQNFSQQKNNRHYVALRWCAEVEPQRLSTLLFRAIEEKNTSHVKYYLSLGADPNRSVEPGGNPPLIAAIDKLSPLNSNDPFLEVVYELIDCGADCTTKGTLGCTSTQMAVHANKLELVKVLLQKIKEAQTYPIFDKRAMQHARLLEYTDIFEYLAEAEKAWEQL